MSNEIIFWLLAGTIVLQIAGQFLDRARYRFTREYLGSLSRQLDLHWERIDIVSQRIDSTDSLLRKVSDTSVTHSKCCVQLLSSYNDLDKRLSPLETDGK